MPEKKGITRPIAQRSEKASKKSTTTANKPLSAPNCGISKSQFIIKGTDVSVGVHPWIAALYLNGKFICGLNIISEVWGLTPAHCFS